ncbi:site-specific DNA-methyltransferase [Baaleninema sp.]|uniref:site-specific DNA-methyltransferase n=1 Tax=Baaleninema sp. TaxID=3101197 RepID=UPI003D0862C4
MFQQLSLFELDTNDHVKCFYRKIQQSGFDYQEIDIGDITFKAGQMETVHRWYRLTPSYSPSLVRFFIKEFQIDRNHFVLDTFSGRGTTSIECQKHGIESLGIEVNPLLQQVGNKSLTWDTIYLDLFKQYLTEVSGSIEKFTQSSIEEVVDYFNTRIPIIHNVFRWWKKPILKDLIICREVMLQPTYEAIRDYVWIALAEACLDCANIHRNHPTITFDDDHQREIDVFFEVEKNLKTIRDDLMSLERDEISFSELGRIELGNSTQNLQQHVNRPVDFVITSPPYPNRYSYVHQTRPQLHFMEVLERVAEATEIDLQAIGGTWGRATSILQKELIEVPTEIEPYLCYHEELKNKSILMCNYATKYFLDMWNHIKHIKEIKASNFQGAYIVGNSRLSGVDIFTESILGKLFQHEGFEVERIVSFRKRGGKKRLYETAVCVKS